MIKVSKPACVIIEIFDEASKVADKLSKAINFVYALVMILFIS